LAAPSLGQGKEGTHAGKEREDGMWPADERDPQAVREKSEARAAAKAERVRVRATDWRGQWNSERDKGLAGVGARSQRHCGQAEQSGRLAGLRGAGRARAERHKGQAETERQARAELGCRAGQVREKAGRSAVGPLGRPRPGKREERSG